MPAEEILSYCEQCAGERNHKIKAEYSDSWSNDEHDVSGGSKNYILKCAGCGHISFRAETWCTEDDGAVQIYPKSASSRAAPSWFEEFSFSSDELHQNLESQLSEVYLAYDAGHYWLTVMGVRAVIETLMLGKIADQGSFSANLSQFSREGLIGDPQRLALEQAIDIGSAAIHRGQNVDRQNALEAIQVAENVVEGVVIQPIRESRLKKR